jgi:hypothetical protein
MKLSTLVLHPRLWRGPLGLSLASLALTSLVFAGCAADTSDPNADDAVDTGVSADEISSRAAQFVGSYSWRAGDSGELVDFQQLTLKSNGTYTAKVDSQLVNPAVRCIAFPCTLPESGAWTVVRSGGKYKVRVDPTGPKAPRSYFASLQPQTHTLTLTRSGHTTDLFTDGSSCANVRCTANTHCEMKGINGGSVPVCIANAPVATCAATLCGPKTTCVDKPTGAECVANAQPACAKQGCSGQICADHSVITTCEFRPEYACYQAATCARQANGQCGWTPSAALTSCLAHP